MAGVLGTLPVPQPTARALKAEPGSHVPCSGASVQPAWPGAGWAQGAAAGAACWDRHRRQWAQGPGCTVLCQTCPACDLSHVRQSREAGWKPPPSAGALWEVASLRSPASLLPLLFCKMSNLLSASFHPLAGVFAVPEPCGAAAPGGAGVPDCLVCGIGEPWAGGVPAKMQPELCSLSHHCHRV